MPVLSPKRQVTIPKELCDRLHVKPGDDLEFVEYNGQITIIKKVKGGSAGVLKHLRTDSRYSDDESLDNFLQKKRPQASAKTSEKTPYKTPYKRKAK
jgi:AbrB family looped-hinge helix DNA binding protein